MTFTPVSSVHVSLDFGDGPQRVGRLAIRQ